MLSGGSKVKFLTVWATLIFNVTLSVNAGASQGVSATDLLMQDLNKAPSYEQFIGAFSRKLLPGDFNYIQEEIKKNPELLGASVKPKLIAEKNNLVIRDGKNSITLKNLDVRKHLWSLNGVPVTLLPFALATERWKSISAALKSSGPSPSSLLTAFWALSNLSKSMDLGASEISIDQTNLAEVFNKAGATGTCSKKYISEFSMAVGGLAIDKIECSHKGSPLLLTFKEGQNFRKISYLKDSGAETVNDQDQLPGQIANCHFNTQTWQSESCGQDQARRSQIQEIHKLLNGSDFCLKCRSLVQSISAKTINRKGTH
jgi:hypothetical protein